MTKSSHSARRDEAVARVSRIAWGAAARERHEGSQIALMREFLRRMALWARAVGAEAEWPFFSVADTLAERSPVVRERLNSIDLSSLDEALSAATFHPKHLCRWYVEWQLIEDLDDVRAFSLPAPYDPIIVAFERGGAFHVENRMFQFGTAQFPFGTVRDRVSEPPITSLDMDSLTHWDATWAAETEQRGRT